jgi:branched-chain amino acid transport system permease protein
VFVGAMQALFGGNYFSYAYLAVPFDILGNTYALNRVVAFVVAVLLCGGLYLWIERSRQGMALRAIAVNPRSAGLVGIDVLKMSALAFALGGAVTACGGILLSTFLTLDASIGIIFTMKALIIVIMGGVGDIRGTLVASLILGIAETLVATLVDPGLTLAAAYLMFLLVLLFRPQGLFGKSPA